jgi:hypothetical protein
MSSDSRKAVLAGGVTKKTPHPGDGVRGIEGRSRRDPEGSGNSERKKAPVAAGWEEAGGRRRSR